MKNAIILAVAVYAAIATLGWVIYSAKSDIVSHQYIQAYNALKAVNSYIEKTADTGEMDSFLESEEGKSYVNILSN